MCGQDCPCNQPGLRARKLCRNAMSSPYQEFNFEVEPFGVSTELENEFEQAEEEYRRFSRFTPSLYRYGRRTPVRPSYQPRPRYQPYWHGGYAPAYFHDHVIETDPGASERVRWVQDTLNRLMGLQLPVDGILGVETRSAIRSFQRRGRLPVTGLPDPDTGSALNDATSSHPTPNDDDSIDQQEIEPEFSLLKGLGRGAGKLDRQIGRTALKSAAIASKSFVVAGALLSPPKGLSITNFNDKSVYRFKEKNDRTGRKITELVLHDSISHSVASTINGLRFGKQPKSVHLIVGPDGSITQHGDLANDKLWHASQHNTASVGVEVVNPYYPEKLKDGMPWTQIIKAGWADKGQYVVPTQKQAEAIAQLTKWITSPQAEGLSIPRTWIGVTNGRMQMNRVSGADKPKPGIYAHTYFPSHADGAWLALYAWLRIEKSRQPAQAYEEAIKLATTPNKYVDLPKS